MTTDFDGISLMVVQTSVPVIAMKESQANDQLLANNPPPAQLH